MPRARKALLTSMSSSSADDFQCKPSLSLRKGGSGMTAKPVMQYRPLSLTLLMLMLAVSVAGAAQTSQFTYQGKLTDTGVPANGNYDLQFKLFDTPTVGAGTQQGTTIALTSVAV